MAFEPGDVVILKSGGQPMTVASVAGDEVLCVWIGEEGELFREKLPAVTLESLHGDDEDLAEDEDEENGDDENGDEDEDEEEEEEEEEESSRRRAR